MERKILLEMRRKVRIMDPMLKDPKKSVQELASKVGTVRARDLLMDAKVNRSTAEKLAGGRYESSVGYELHLKIDKALAAAAKPDKQTA